jgi:hypothetical protein
MKSPQNFERLVLGCMDRYDSNQVVLLQHFSRSTRSSYFCTAQPSKFEQKIVKTFAGIKKNEISFSSRFSMNFAIVLRNFDEFLPEFHINFQEMIKCLGMLTKSATKVRKMPEISGNFPNL